MAGRDETVDDIEILEFVESTSDPVATTAEVAEAFGFSNSGMLKRLHPLEDASLLHSKKAGRTLVWWITESGKERVKGEE
ncbi:hypothetical protein [Halovivax limisalsi]|uniref:hypothetical protein n=1 Tax=Halovivax limisalsi TaxID=1453760 RepID=UPI001FFDA16E|nr:hypothetical protein [Halovivax limisalsi]